MTEIIIGGLLGIFLFSVIVFFIPKIFVNELNRLSDNLHYNSAESSNIK